MRFFAKITFYRRLHDHLTTSPGPRFAVGPRKKAGMAVSGEDVIDFFAHEGISEIGAIPLGAAKIIRRDKLERLIPQVFSDGCEAPQGSLLLFLMPYLVCGERRNISAYAAAKDYHIFFRELAARLIPALRSRFPGYAFAGAADSSPADEVNGAALAGLGVIGDNGLLINKRYGSYVFIGGIYSDMPCEKYGFPAPAAPGSCLHCGKCRAACPVGIIGADAKKSVCLSALTQKKGALTPSEAEEIKKHLSAWGCDICQDVCPMNRAAEETEIGFFRQDRLPFLTLDAVSGMNDEEFSSRAYSWRGRETILRNLEIFSEE